MSRILAPEESPPLDYTVFSVIIATLVMVLVVEVVRHQLDVAASGNQFFKTVVELMYRELTTLGIVEFFIYLLHKYHKSFNFAMEVVFVDVHFMLFYTAFFNAIQSVLVRLLTSRRTNRTWIQTEDIDIGHYVAIRKEFDRVENDWKALQYGNNGGGEYVSNMSVRSSVNQSFIENDESEHLNLGRWEKFKRNVNIMYMKVRYPRLFMRRRKLLVPVRFHELRCHFIEQNGLSAKFKVSRYLQRSLTSVLLDFVHISSAAWIMVMALAILLYYISGIILNVSANKLNVYEFLIWTMGVGVVLFLIISVVLFVKMRTIVAKILVMKLTIEDENSMRKTYRGFSALKNRSMKYYDQINLFWAGNPKIIIVLTQFMQFGYALGLAAIFTYWQQFSESPGPQFKAKLLVALIVSYGFFLHLLGDILPWFTVCTSLGQLVNKERLHETMAKMKLSEELRRVEAAAEAAEIEKELALRKKKLEEKLNDTIRSAGSKKEEILPIQDKKSLSGGVGIMRIFREGSSRSRHESKRSLSDGVHLMASLKSKSEDALDILHSASRLSDAAAEQLCITDEGEGTNIEELLADKQECSEPVVRHLSDGSSPSFLTNSQPVTESTGLTNGFGNSALSRQERKHRRMRSKSEGVVTMRASLDTGNISKLPTVSETNQEAKLKTLSELVNMPAKDLPPVPEKRKRERMPRLRAISEGVSMMQLEPIGKDLTKTTQAVPGATNASTNSTLSREERKHRRKRSQSAGVATMRLSQDTMKMLMPSSSAGEIINQQPKLETLSELAKVPAKDLPKIPEKEKRERSSRLKAISDGVSSMRALTAPTNQGPIVDNKTAPISPESCTDEPTSGDEKKIVFSPENDKLLTVTSLDSVESIDGDSDIDDVPECDMATVAIKPKKESFDVATFLQGHRYHNLSLLFGPMVCSFLVAMRVEGFNMIEGVLIDYNNTFHLALKTCFWMETAWFSAMTIERFVALIVFTRKGNSKEILSAILGLCNVTACMALLMVSETKRCCMEDAALRSLASAEYGGEYYAVDTSTECSCSNFGSRTYGGLGYIEPYTFIIALGPLRFMVAGPIVRLFRRKTDEEEEIHHKPEEHHDHHHGSDPEQVRNIWLTTIGMHSEVAKKYGLFSIEILHCMLGLEIPEKTPEDKTEEKPGDSSQELINSTPTVSAPESVKESSLTLYQDGVAALSTLNNSLGIAFDENEFAFPDSKLIRRMRRCERKLLPLLDTWMLVDVVLTNHELVILEVPEDDLISQSNDATEASGALSDGGKGLSLEVAVKGRNVVSKFSLEEIDHIDIEHSLSIHSGGTERDVESNCQPLGEYWQGCNNSLTYNPAAMCKRWCHVDEDRLKIHFNNGCGTLYLRLLVDLKEKEIGRNVLSRDESASLLSTVGAETKIWCRTIARLCGVANLKMDLPHFGDSTGDEELADFVKLTEREGNNNGGKQHRRRLTSFQSTRW